MAEEEKKALEEQPIVTNEGTENEEQSVVTEQPAYVATPREPAQLRNWYETLFRQDNAGEEAEISDEQRRKMQRRERAERVIAGLGDIGTHIANIAFAGKGATPAKPTTTMSENIDKAWSRYNQDIETRRKEYRQGLSAARKLDYQRYLDDRRQQLAYDREERMRWQQEHKYDLDKLREAKTKAEIARIEKKTPAEIAVLEQQAAYWEARANESQARADGRIPSRGYSKGARKANNGEPTKSELLEEYYALGGKLPKGRNGLAVDPTAGQLKDGIRALRETQNLPAADWDKPKKDYTASGNKPSGGNQQEKPSNSGRDWSKYKK